MISLESINFARIAASEAAADAFRAEAYRYVVSERPSPLISPATANTKMRKSQRAEYRIVSLNLAHARTSGFQTCPQAGDCEKLCVGSNSVGLSAIWPTIAAGRIRKTRLFFENRELAIVQLVGELERERRAAERAHAGLVVRLNTFSDIPWEAAAWGMVPQLFLSCGVNGPGSFLAYDYTKLHARVMKSPANYRLTGSWSEVARHQEHCFDLLNCGYNVSMAFAEHGSFAGNRALGQHIPIGKQTVRIFGQAFDCFSGDLSDLRFLDVGPDSRGYGSICGLAFKSGNNATRNVGLASGFVNVTG